MSMITTIGRAALKNQQTVDFTILEQSKKIMN